MAEAGLLGEDDGSEPLEGEIAEMGTVEARHAASVRVLARRLQQQFGDRVIVSVQNPIHRSPPLADLGTPVGSRPACLAGRCLPQGAARRRGRSAGRRGRRPLCQHLAPAVCSAFPGCAR